MAKNVVEDAHPVLHSFLTELRKDTTPPAQFRAIMTELAHAVALAASRHLPLKPVVINTPVEKKASVMTLADDLVVVSILRAGNGMLDGVLRVFPGAQVGHIGIYRDKFIKSTVEYFFRLPESVAGKKIFIVDPLLATGETLISAIERLMQYGVTDITVLSILVAPEGAGKLLERFPNVKIHCVSLERQLNEKGYILPGLGDAGDRLYGTL